MADKKKLVNVYDPDTGDVGSIDSSQLEQALSTGYERASPEQVDAYYKEKEFGTAGQQALTALEGAASAATFGGSTAAQVALGLSTPENIAARREVNPVSHMVGQGAGLVGTAFIPSVGAANLMERAGLGAAKAIGLGAAEGLAAKVGSAAVKGAVENAIFQAGDEVSKMFSTNYENPVDAIDTAKIILGSGVAGGILGGAAGAISPLWDATVGRTISKELTNVADNLAVLNETGAIVSKAAPELGTEQFIKRNTKEILDAEERLRKVTGIDFEVTPGTLSEKKIFQDWEGEAIKRPTLTGQSLAQQQRKVYDGLKKASEDVLSEMTDKTKFEVGKKIKEGIINKLEQEIAPIEMKYKELKPILKEMPVFDEAKKAAIDRIKSNELVTAIPGSILQKTANRISKEIDSLKTVDSIKTYRTMLNGKINQAVRNASEELPILLEAKQALNSLREASIERAAASGKFKPSVLDELRSADELYSGYKTKLKDFGVEAGLGSINNARGMLERFKKTSDESFVNKVLDTKDVNQMEFFKRNFPEQFELAKKYNLREIYEKSINEARGKNGEFDVGKFLRQTDDTKLPAEAKKVLFGDKSAIIDDVRTIYRAIPGDLNPSGTAAALSLGDFLSPDLLKVGTSNLGDLVSGAIAKKISTIARTPDKAKNLALLKFMASSQGIAPRSFEAMVRLIDSAIKGENLLAKTVKGVFTSGRIILPSKILPNEQKRKDLDKAIVDFQVNQDDLFKTGDEMSVYLPEQGTAMAESRVRAINYLSSIKPKTVRLSPMDNELKPSKAEQSAYNRALDIAEQPLIVLESVKDGTITSKDMEHLTNLAPSLYKRMAQKMMSDMIDHMSAGGSIPYKTRMGISLFLGKPLDSTLTPQGVSAAQSGWGMLKPSDAQKMMKPINPSATSLSKLKKVPNMYETPAQSAAMRRTLRD